MKRLGLALLFVILTAAAAIAAPIDAGHVLITPLGDVSDPTFIIPYTIADDSIAAPGGGEGHWDGGPTVLGGGAQQLLVQAKPGLVLRSMSLSMPIAGTSLQFSVDGALSSLVPPLDFSLFAPGTTEALIVIGSNFVFDAEHPFFSVGPMLIHFGTIAAVPEPAAAIVLVGGLVIVGALTARRYCTM